MSKKDDKIMPELSGDGSKSFAKTKGIICFNRSKDGECLAYTHETCKANCEARIPTIDQKIELLRSLLSYAKSKVDSLALKKELEEALEVQQSVSSGKYEDWMTCYYEDRHRGSGGGSSEHDSNRSTGMKTLMKDNRSVGVKPTKSQNEEYQKALREWEEQNEKLPKLARSSMGHSKEDSYLTSES